MSFLLQGRTEHSVDSLRFETQWLETVDVIQAGLLSAFLGL